MSPRLTEEQLDRMERLGCAWITPGQFTSLLSEVRRARLMAPYIRVMHKPECHESKYHHGGICFRRIGEPCPGCTCGLSALEASE